jgi:toxin HigB-1
MIRSFANKETEEVFHGVHTHAIHKTIPSHLLKLTEERLDLLNGADSYESLCLIPSIHSDVVCDAHGKYSIPIQDNWRLCFRWNKDGPCDVEIKS